MRDPYAVLGVSKSADADTIRKTFKSLARKYHPDLNKAAAAEQRFKEINEAYGIVGDEEKRKLWDEFGEVSTKPGFDAAKARAWKQSGGFGGGFPGGGFGGGAGGFPGGGFGAGDFDDILSNMFGGGRRRSAGFGRGAGPRKGPDIELTATVSVADLITGAAVPLRFQRPGPAGRSVAESLRFKIPAGIRDGDTVRLRGKGGEGAPGGPRGDLKVTVAVRSSKWLDTVGDDVVMTVPITLGEAVAGGAIDVPTPEGSVRVKVPPGTSGGQKLRLKGRGLRKKGDERGNLVLTLQPRLPKLDADAMQRTLEEVEAAYEASPRDAIRF